ncbi:NACHT domain-containing protein [Mycolicibacterium sp.]|uniref:NACHT domain-containing protein n=1 Tax=Mycolicibacterium sp. TaxID=2320850 RepID=UPI0037CBE61A
METDFAYEQLSAEAFEQLSVALAASVIGAGVEVYGRGPDGGREATYTGTINWSATTDDDGLWDGYTVLQAKQCQTVMEPAANLNWLKTQIHDEFNTWMNPKSRRQQRFPNYLLVVSNARLSPNDPGGGVDDIRKYVTDLLDREYDPPDDHGAPRTPRRRGLREVRVWHRDKLNALLVQNADIRTRFAPLVTLGDLLARLQRLDAILPGLIPHDSIAGVLHEHAQTTLVGDRWVRFDEAGDDFNHQSVEQVIFDLPVRNSHEERTSALRSVLDRGNQVLSRTIPHAGDQGEHRAPRHLVITGAPGNGKSTLAKYLTQIYRAAFARTDTAEPAVSALIDATDASLRRLELDPPSNPRWPLRVDLAPMAEKMGPDSAGPNLRRYVCDQISLDSPVPVHVGTLDAWLRLWPSVLLLDGLDEVTHPALRHRVLHEITDLLDKADALDADLFVIITTRPTGYTPLLPQRFEQLDLDFFTLDEARHYGRHVTTQRLARDPEYQRSTLARFDDAVASTTVERLLTTPLQVLILTVIIARQGPLPTNRYELFWTYYDTVFKREAAKNTQLRDFFNRHRSEITDLHQRVGIVLHRLCEATRELRGRMGLEELTNIARDRMMELGHSLDAAKEMAATLVTIATHRLVLLSADDDSLVSFDIRSLQELMAGCALVDAPETTARNNLISAACSPHWRNSWLFGAGRLFSGPDHQRELVLDVVETCDQEGHWSGWLYPAGPELAADILDDGLAADKPTHRRRLIEVVLRALNGPMPEDAKSLSQKLSAATNTQGLLQGLPSASVAGDRAYVRERLRQTFADTDPTHAGYAVAATLLHYGSLGTNIPGQPADPQRFADAWTHRDLGTQVRLGAYLLGTLQNYDPGAYPPSTLVFEALDECNQLLMTRNDSGVLRALSTGEIFNCAHVHAALTDPEASAELQIILEAIPPHDWAARSLLARAYWPAASRWPVASLIKVAGDSR